MSLSVRTAAAVCLLAGVPTRAAPLTLPDALASALKQSPRLISAEAEVAAAEARLRQAELTFQSNPEIDAEAGPRWRATEGSVDLAAGLSQRLEVFGQQSLRRGAAEADLAAAQARLAAERLAVAAEVRTTFGRVLAARQEVEIARDALALAKSALIAAEARLAAGAASLIEVNTARVEVGRAAQEANRAERALIARQGAVALLAGLEPGGSPEIEGTLAKRTAPPPEPLDALIAQAMERRPELKVARALQKNAEAEGGLAVRETLPSPTLGVAYQREEAADILQGTLRFELPVFNRNPGRRGAASARLTEARRLEEAAARQIRGEVRIAYGRLQAARAAAELYGEDVIASLEQNLALVTEGYRAGKVDFLQLVIIRRETLDARRGYVAALEELNAASAELERAVGGLP